MHGQTTDSLTPSGSRQHWLDKWQPPPKAAHLFHECCVHCKARHPSVENCRLHPRYHGRLASVGLCCNELPLIGCDAPHCSPMPSVVGSIVPVMITVSVVPVGMDVLVTAGLFTVTSSDRLPLAFTRRTCTMRTLRVCPRDTDHENRRGNTQNLPMSTASSSQYILCSNAPRRQGGCQA